MKWWDGMPSIWKWKLLSHVQLFATPWTKYNPWNSPGQNNGVGSPSPGDLPNPGIEPSPPTLQADSLSSERPGKPILKPKTCCILTSVFIASPEVPHYSFSWYHAPGILVLEHFKPKMYWRIAETSQVALVVKNPATSAGDMRSVGSIPGLGRSTRVGNGNPL